MNIVDLINTFFEVVSLILGIFGPASEPCTRENYEVNYRKFVHKHVLQTDFDRNSPRAWESYLKDQQLWCRVGAPIQSFVEPSQNVDDVCTDGLRVLNGGNLCISQSEMKVYDVTTTKNNDDCTIDVQPRQTYVIVACDKVGNRCLPVHYEKYINQKKTSVHCSPQ